MSKSEGAAAARWSFFRAESLRDVWPGAWFEALADPFRATVTRREFPRMRLEGVDAAPFRCQRTSLGVGARPVNVLSINVVVSGELRMREGPLEYRAGPGDVFIHRNGACFFECTTPTRTHRAVVDPRLMPPALSKERPLGLCAPSALTRAYSRFMDEVLASALSLGSAADDAVLEQSALSMQRGLVASVLRQHPPEERSPEELRRQVAAYIDHHLVDPELGIKQISQDLQISRRWLFRLFEGEAESIASGIRRLRVERATRDLEQHPDLAVQEIGRRNGFSSRDVFTRAFRGLRGHAPVEHRARVKGDR